MFEESGHVQPMAAYIMSECSSSSITFNFRVSYPLAGSSNIGQEES